MIPQVIQKSKAKIIEICRKHQIRELSLFGSQIRGDFTDDSDFDFLVDFLPDAERDFIVFGRIQNELEEIVNSRVDLVPKNGLKELIRPQVLSEAEIVFSDS
jgi:uncharacterized protein